MAEENFFNLSDPDQGVPRQLTEAITARVFAGDQAMLSLVTLAPHAVGKIHEPVQGGGVQWFVHGGAPASAPALGQGNGAVRKTSEVEDQGRPIGVLLDARERRHLVTR